MNKEKEIQEAKENADIIMKVQEAQAQHLYRQTWGGLIGVLVITLAVCIALWQVNPQWKQEKNQ